MTLSERLATFEIALCNIKRILEGRAPQREALELIHYTVMEALLEGADLGLEVAAVAPLDGPTVPESEWLVEAGPQMLRKIDGSLLDFGVQETPPPARAKLLPRWPTWRPNAADGQE